MKINFKDKRLKIIFRGPFFMKHQVYAFLLCISFSLYADNDSHVADKSQRIGRFSYEDSFDENLVEDILKHSPSIVKKNIKRLLYPSSNEDIPQRLLLLGGTSNATTTAVAKTIALRCGYEYYVINAAALLQEYREGRQMLLSEVRPIIKSGKPIALIITELPEMTDYSGVLASTLWLLLDQAAQYSDVLVIGTSAFERGQLSEDVKERFGENILSFALNKSIRDRIESTAIKASWLERHKIACMVAAAVTGCALMAAHVAIQIFFITKQREKENLDKTSLIIYENILAMAKEREEEQRKEQQDNQKQYSEFRRQQLENQNKQYNMQCKQFSLQEEQQKLLEDKFKALEQKLEDQYKQGKQLLNETTFAADALSWKFAYKFPRTKSNI